MGSGRRIGDDIGTSASAHPDHVADHAADHVLGFAGPHQYDAAEVRVVSEKSESALARARRWRIVVWRGVPKVLSRGMAG